MAEKVLIGGGTGFIGSHLIKTLKQVGYGSIIVSRMPGPENISWTDLAKNGIPNNVTAVVSLAGQNVLDPTRRWTDGFKQNVWTSRINTTSALADAVSKADHKPKVFVSISGVGIYPPSLSKEYDEDSPVERVDFLSKLAYNWEAAAKIDSQPPIRTVIIRSGVVLGRSGGMIKQLWLPFYLGVGGPVGTGNQFMPWIHVHDMSRLILHCIDNNNVRSVLNGVAPQIITNKEFTQSFAKALWRPAVIPLPVSILNIIFSGERAKIMTEGQKVHPKRTLATGFKFDFPTIDEACKDIVAGKNN